MEEVATELVESGGVFGIYSGSHMELTVGMCRTRTTTAIAVSMSDITTQ